MGGDIKIMFYPESYQKKIPSKLPRNFECEFQINVIVGHSARIELTLHGLPDGYQGQAPVQLIDKLSGVEEIYSANDTHYFFVADGGRIKLTTGQNDIYFGFELHYQDFPPLRDYPMGRKISLSDSQPHIFQSGQQYYFGRITADTRISATVVVDKIQAEFLRSLLFFDGPNWSSKVLGTGYTMIRNKTQFVSTGKVISFYSMGWKYHPHYILLQNYENTKDIVEFQGLGCRKEEDCGYFILDGTNGPAVLQSYNPSDVFRTQPLVVITKIEGCGKLDVYIGGRGENPIATYTPKTTKPNLPQLFFGQLKTYVVTGGKLKIHFSRILDDFQNQTIGGKGFFTSLNYGHPSENQDSYSEIVLPEKAIIRVKIRDIDLTGSTKLILTGYRDGSLVYLENIDYFKPGLSAGETFNTTNDSFYGEKLDVHYKTDNDYNDGFYMEFAVEKSSSSEVSKRKRLKSVKKTSQLSFESLGFAIVLTFLFFTL